MNNKHIIEVIQRLAADSNRGETTELVCQLALECIDDLERRLEETQDSEFSLHEQLKSKELEIGQLRMANASYALADKADKDAAT